MGELKVEGACKVKQIVDNLYIFRPLSQCKERAKSKISHAVPYYLIDTRTFRITYCVSKQALERQEELLCCHRFSLPNNVHGEICNFARTHFYNKNK
jgi:hypothetical protein